MTREGGGVGDGNAVAEMLIEGGGGHGRRI